MFFRAGLPSLPCEIQEITDADPAQQIINQGRLADQHTQPERRNDGMNRQTCRNADGSQQPRAPTPIERKGGQISHIRPRREFEQQDRKDEFQHVAPALPPANKRAPAYGV
jgi:hypothetical protein